MYLNGQGDLKIVMKFCSVCGARIRADKSFCQNCGASNEEQFRAARSIPAHQTVSAQQTQYPVLQERQVRSELSPQEYRQPPALQSPHQNRKPEHTDTVKQYTAQQHVEPPPEKQSDTGVSMKKIVIVLVLIMAVILGAVVFAYFYFKSAISNAPDMRANPRGEERLDVAGTENILRPGQGAGSSGIVRNTNKYTFLVLGADQGEYNTDVIMVVTFDAAVHKLDVVNIPRDTLVNVSWNTKKANSLLANMRAKHRGEEDSESKALQSTIGQFAGVLGFETDYWVLVNLQAFVSLIDAIDGVDFYVPVNMNYDDRAGGLSIHYSEGTHHLSGQQAVEVMRYRAGYSSGDIGRIGTQQSFLKSAAQQILEKKGSLSVIDLARIFLSNVKTDLKLDDLIWFGYEFMKLDADDIGFHMLPGNFSDSFRGNSYVSIYVDEWLEIVNNILNPFDCEIKAGDVSILTRGPDKRLYVTDGNRQGDASWGS